MALDKPNKVVLTSNDFCNINIYCQWCGNSFNAFSLTMTNIIFPDYIFCDTECFGNWQLQQIIDKKMESDK